MYSADYLGQLAVSLDIALVKRGLTLDGLAAELGCSIDALNSIRDRQADPPFSLAMKIFAAADYPGLMTDPQLSRMESKLESLLTAVPVNHSPEAKPAFLSAASKDRLAAVGSEVGTILNEIEQRGTAEDG